MDALFEVILQMSLSASVMAIAVMLLRPFLKKAPKWIICALWALVALRLLCPLTLESPVSMMPDTAPMAQQVISLQPDEPVISIGQTIRQENGQPVHIPTDIPEAPFQIHFWMIWVAGAGLMLLYLLYSYVTVSLRVRVFFEAEPGVRQCDAIDTPFIFGILRPRIYLPSTLAPEGIPFVVAHERAHLKRKDHLWKPLGFLLLTLHWFNPILWVAYILLCRDIELACDERVIRTMTPAEKQAYSLLLLQCSRQQRFVTACPLAFGEVGVKDRIRSILHYKKPAFWIILVTLLLGLGLGVFFLTDRPEENPRQTAALEAVVETILVGDRLEVQVLDSDYTGMLVISTEGLDIPVLTKGDRILLTYDPADDLSDGYLETVFDLAELEEPPAGRIDRLEKHLEGIVLSLDAHGLQVQTEVFPGTVYWVSLEGFSLDLKRGDVVMVHYYPGEDPERIEEVTSINRTEEADFDVRLHVSEVTATGLQLEILVDSNLPLTTTDNITLKTADWKSVKKLPGGAFPDETYTLTEGVFTVDWSQVYGALEPGQYRLYKPIYYEERELIHVVDFTVPQSPATTPEEKLNQIIQRFAAEQLTYPSDLSDSTLERLALPANGSPLVTGLVTGPLWESSEIKTYAQITVSHTVLEHTASGNSHTYSIAACARGYNDRQLIDSRHCSMRIVIQRNTDGTYIATSCQIPTQQTWQADAEMLFSPEIAKRLREDQALWDSLEKACDEQVTGGVLEIKGEKYTFQPGSTEATLIENAIASGKKLQKSYEDASVCTLLVGDTAYYFYFDKGVIHNATEDIYIQLTEEGTKTVSTIFQTAEAQ